ncbi:hypothetical protein K503DRAFT_288320 [Rhizopogon vinicolor AM-OR11-026]|uniref:Uncharacterized protein n=1 Tax=Rhizopogon vinicolor AM-OR11-026 TaxID=1314800 RepID=A0A1B7MVI1_9AGAM|nr:hypothetical protein K503DRAFT_288320 [Rhizopogon vinicolor AM-OR11-026]
MSPSTGSDAWLAYADDYDEDTPVVMPLDIRKSSALSGTDKVKFLRVAHYCVGSRRSSLYVIPDAIIARQWQGTHFT